MKFTKEWIDEYVEQNLTADEIADMITMAGLEVDTVSPVCGQFDGVVVAKVVECEDHPDSDHLHVTKVDCGDGELHQVVCGAPNCRAGLKSAFAKIGAKLPGITIKKAKLRGVESEGMICSYAELGMAEESDGIIELPEDALVGADVHEYLKLDDKVIDIDLTTNRPDCLGVRGIAREVAVLCGGKFKDLQDCSVRPTCDDKYTVEVIDKEACPRYLHRIVKNVNPKAKSPLWLTERLRRVGIRSISPIVDVTNYVMMELGQPIHSFDLDKLKSKIIVRKAYENEKLTVLSGEELTLKSDTLVIADEEGAIGIAGVFGGLNSGIGTDTVNVLFEVAFFAPDAIKGRPREYGLATDASHRNERGVDPYVQRLAMERVTSLLISIAGGECGPVGEELCEEYLPKRNQIAMRLDRLALVLGKKIEAPECMNILDKLGMKPVQKDENTIAVTAPSFRFDIEIEEDLFEEIARIHGYDNIENVCPKAMLVMGNRSEKDVKDRTVRRTLTSLGYNEAITYSFTDPKILQVLSNSDPVILKEPISIEMSAMRTSVLCGLLTAAKYNINRQQKRVRLFECGLRYIKDDSSEFGINQEPMVAGLITGSCEDESWAEPQRNVDFFDVKGDVEALLALTCRQGDFKVQRTSQKYLHPGRGADLYLDGVMVGSFGMLHPVAQKALGFKQSVGVFEIKQSAILKRTVPVCSEISKFPSVRRDFAFVLDKQVEAQALLDVIGAECGALLSEARIFDVFTGQGLGDKKSIALGVTLQDTERTLDDAAVDEVALKIVAAVKDKLGGVLRS